jgi:hypothetical protein
METHSISAEDLTAPPLDAQMPSERLPHHADASDVEQSSTRAAGELERPVQSPAAEAAEETSRGPGWQNRVGFILAIVVVTIGPCGALLVALGQATIGRNVPPEAPPAAASPPVLHLAVDDQPTTPPESLPSPPTAEARDVAAIWADPAPKTARQKSDANTPSHPTPKSYLSKAHPPRRGVTAAVAPVKSTVHEAEHGGPYARTGNGPGNFFIGDR